MSTATPTRRAWTLRAPDNVQEIWSDDTSTKYTTFVTYAPEGGDTLPWGAVGVYTHDEPTIPQQHKAVLTVAAARKLWTNHIAYGWVLA